MAPSIYGHDNIKRALALSMFGGEPKNPGMFCYWSYLCTCSCTFNLWLTNLCGICALLMYRVIPICVKWALIRFRMSIVRTRLIIIQPRGVQHNHMLFCVMCMSHASDIGRLAKMFTKIVQHSALPGDEHFSVGSDVSEYYAHQQSAHTHIHTLRFDGHLSKWTWVSWFPPLFSFSIYCWTVHPFGTGLNFPCHS